jgi:hypothetical protein
MIFPVILLAIVVAPLVAVAFSVRDRQLMAPAVGAIGMGTRVRSDARLRGTPVAWAVLAPLAIIEARRLVRHPAPYLIALPLCALSLSNLLWSSVQVYERTDVDLVILVVPYAWGTLIASNLLTLRSRRWRSEELLVTTPTPQRSRTVAHLLAPIAMLPGAMVLLAVAVVIGRLSGRALGLPRSGVLLSALFLVVGGGCLGVAVARWLPRPVFGWVAVIATMVLQVNLGYLDPRWRWLHFSMNGVDSLSNPALAPDHHLVHALYLLGGILLVAAIALARDGVDRNVAGLGATATVVIVATGVIQTAIPAANELERYAARLEDPAAHQVCERIGTTTYCADPDYVDLVAFWREPVEGVLARAPGDAAGGDLVVRQRPLIDARANLLDEVAVRVDPALAWPDDGEVSVSNQWALPAPEDQDATGRFQLALAFRTASALVGLPPDAWWTATSDGSSSWATIPLADPKSQVPVRSPLVQCSAIGDARGVAAAWLAGQSTPAAREALRTRAATTLAFGTHAEPHPFDAVDTYTPGYPYVLPEQGAVLSGYDVIAAAALLALDDDEVADQLARRWPEVSGRGGMPATTTELLGWFGLDPDAATRVLSSAPLPHEHADELPSPPVLSSRCPAASS